MTLPGFALDRGSPVSRALLSWDARDRSLRCRSGQVLTFTRPSIGTFRDRDGRVGLASEHAPRWTAAEGATPGIFDEFGLLLEPARTNLILRSTEFDHAAWTKTGLGTVTANVATAPDTTVAAEKLPETSATSEHKVTQAVTITAGNYVAVSVFAKAAERTRVTLRALNGSDILAARFDLSAVTATDITSGGGTFRGAGVERWGDGWFRCWIVGRVNAGSTAITMEVALTSGTTTSYAGTTGSGLFVWGAQFEQVNNAGAKPSSFIPTSASTVTRSADLLTGTMLWSFVDSLTTYTRFVRPPWAALPSQDNDAYLYTLSTTPPRTVLYLSQSSLAITAVYEDATPTGSFASAAIPAGAVLEVAVQLSALLTGGRSRIDVGSGYGSLGGTVAAASAWGNGTFRIGEAFSIGFAPVLVLQALRVVPGLRTRAEMQGLY